MAQLVNTFEGGTAGVTLTAGSGGNTGGASGDFFNAVVKPSDGILQFDTDAYLGSLSLKMASRTVSAGLDVQWQAASRGTIADDYIRFYFKTDDINTGGLAKNIIRWFSGASSLGGILMGNNRLYITDQTNAVVTGNSTTLLPANQWVRIEAHLHPRTDGTGSLQIKLWVNPASSGTPDWDYTLSGLTYPAASTDQILIGNSAPGTNWPTATGFIRFDGIVTGASTWVGPPAAKAVSPSGIAANTVVGSSLNVIRGGGGSSGVSPVYGVAVYGVAAYGGTAVTPAFKISATSTVRGAVGKIQATPTPGPVPIPYVPPEPPAEIFTEIGPFARAVYSTLNLDNLLDTDNARSWVLQFIGAIGAAFQQMDDLAHIDPDVPNDIPWGRLLDVDRIPDEGLAWFGQFMGVTLNPNLDANGQRQQIRDRIGWRRGTVPVMTSAIAAFLTGTQTVEFVERDTSPYHFNVATYSDETSTFARQIIPGIINDNKPAGLQYTYTLITGSPSTSDSYENLFVDFSSYSLVFSTEQSYEDTLLNP